jgi:hypothetical protein
LPVCPPVLCNVLVRRRRDDAGGEAVAPLTACAGLACGAQVKSDVKYRFVIDLATLA